MRKIEGWRKANWSSEFRLHLMHDEQHDIYEIRVYSRPHTQEPQEQQPHTRRYKTMKRAKQAYATLLHADDPERRIKNLNKNLGI